MSSAIIAITICKIYSLTAPAVASGFSAFWSLSWPLKIGGTAVVTAVFIGDPINGTLLLISCGGALLAQSYGLLPKGNNYASLEEKLGIDYFDLKLEEDKFFGDRKVDSRIRYLFSMDEPELSCWEIFRNFLNNLPWDNYYFLSFLIVFVVAICFILYHVLLSLKKEEEPKGFWKFFLYFFFVTPVLLFFSFIVSWYFSSADLFVILVWSVLIAISLSIVFFIFLLKGGKWGKSKEP